MESPTNLKRGRSAIVRLPDLKFKQGEVQIGLERRALMTLAIFHSPKYHHVDYGGV